MTAQQQATQQQTTTTATKAHKVRPSQNHPATPTVAITAVTVAINLATRHPGQEKDPIDTKIEEKIENNKESFVSPRTS